MGNVCIGAVFALIGLASLGAGLVHVFRLLSATSARVHVIGIVVGLQTPSTGLAATINSIGHGGRASLFHPIIEFPGPHGMQRFIGPFGSRPSFYSVGDTVKVRYRVGNVATPEIDSIATDLMGCIPFIIGVVFLAVGLGLLVWGP